MIRHGLPLLAVAVLCGALAPPVNAQHFDEAELARQRNAAESPERFALELRAGTYVPDVGTSAFDLFGDDRGPLIGGELDGFITRIPYVGLIGLGVGFGWAEYKGSAQIAGSSETASEKTTLRLFPVSPMVVLRIDTLAREFSIPFVFTGKLGVDFIIWDSKTGSNSDGSAVSRGLRWAAQAALELDFFNRAAARRLDEEWGINHSFLFFEIYDSLADSNLRLTPEDPFAWSAGLGLIF